MEDPLPAPMDLTQINKHDHILNRHIQIPVAAKPEEKIHAGVPGDGKGNYPEGDNSDSDRRIDNGNSDFNKKDGLNRHIQTPAVEREEDLRPEIHGNGESNYPEGDDRKIGNGNSDFNKHDIQNRHVQIPVAAKSEQNLRSEIHENGNPNPNYPEEDNFDSDRKIANDYSDLNKLIRPHSQLPKPSAPPGVMERSLSLPETLESPAMAIGKFFREKSNSVSAAITKRISSLTRDDVRDYEIGSEVKVKEFNLVGIKVVKALKDERKELKGRISFFSRSNCRDSGAVRSFMREWNFNYVEINIDVYPGREKELRERTGGATVPQIFFNEKLIGGLVVLNSLRNSGMLESKMVEILGRKCPEEAPAPPVYGFDEEDEVVAKQDEMAEIVRIVRLKVPIQDRIMKMKFVKNCFSGVELVEAILHHMECGRKKVHSFFLNFLLIYAIIRLVV